MKGEGARWRVGRKIGKNLYRDDIDVGRMDTDDLAAEVVEAMNDRAAIARVRALCDQWAQAVIGEPDAVRHTRYLSASLRAALDGPEATS